MVIELLCFRKHGFCILFKSGHKLRCAHCQNIQNRTMCRSSLIYQCLCNWCTNLYLYDELMSWTLFLKNLCAIIDMVLDFLSKYKLVHRWIWGVINVMVHHLYRCNAYTHCACKSIVITQKRAHACCVYGQNNGWCKMLCWEVNRLLSKNDYLHSHMRHNVNDVSMHIM